MSKNNAAGGGGKTGAEQQEEEEFVIVEVDNSGKPINQGEAAGHDSEDDDQDEVQDEEQDDHDEDSDEQRMGHAEGEQEEETPEERRERRKREQRAKRVRNRVTAEAKDRLIQNQGRTLLNLQEQVAKLEGRTIRYDVNLLQSQLSQIEAQQGDAKVVLAKLVKAGDGEGVAEVTEMQMQLRDQHRQITEQLKRAKGARKSGQQESDGEEGSVSPPQPSRRASAPDPEILRRAVAWASRHPFADPKKGDPEEIQIVRAIDHNMTQEGGWDPHTDEYWTELTSRVKRRLPQYFKKPAPNGEGNGGRRVNGDNGNRRPAQGGPRMAPASQSGGGSRPLGKNEVRVTPDRKAAMIAAGKWDDPAKRNRMLAEYARYDRENTGQS
jgi:hypothetical protein